MNYTVTVPPIRLFFSPLLVTASKRGGMVFLLSVPLLSSPRAVLVGLCFRLLPADSVLACFIIGDNISKLFIFPSLNTNYRPSVFRYS